MFERVVSDVRITIDENKGARMASWQIGDLQLLAPFSEDLAHSIDWGNYPMAPWTGRVPNGIFEYDGKRYQLPINFGSHSIHGTTFDRAWKRHGDQDLYSIDLGADWPFPGSASVHYHLEADSLLIQVKVTSEKDVFPACCGLHPWFLRHLARGGKAQLDFQAKKMYVRKEDDEIVADLIEPTPPSWDDCFTDVSQPVTITWPNALELKIVSSHNHWVVYTQPSHALCVEPMTGPPGSINIEPRLISPENPLVLEVRFSWKRLN